MYVFEIYKHSQSKKKFILTHSVYTGKATKSDIFARIMKQTMAAFPKSNRPFVPTVSVCNLLRLTMLFGKPFPVCLGFYSCEI